MKHNKIIFLDVDGVINIPPYEKFDNDCLERLFKIVKQTNAKIVISSSWRMGKLDLTIEGLEKEGFPKDLSKEIVGETIRNYHYTKEGSSLELCRGNEIATYVSRNLKYPWHANPEMDEQYRIYDENKKFVKMNSNKAGVDFSYLILDDDTDMLLCQKDYFVNTDGLKGITEDIVKRSIEILNKINK